PQLEGVAGIDYTYQVNGTTGEYFIPNYLRNSGGVYLIENWQLKKNNEHHYLTGGARFDLAQLNVSGIQNDSVQRFSKTYSNLVGNVGYIYRHNHHLDFVATVGNTYRIPTINELFSNGTHDATYTQGDRNLQPEKALFAQISTRYSSLKWNLSVNIYSYYFFNYIAYQAMNAPVITDHGALPSFEYKQTKANYSGIDLYFDINFTKWLNFQLKGALVRAFDLNTNAHLAYIPADRLQPALKFTHVTAKKDQFSATIGASLVNRQYKAPVEYGFVKAPNGYALMDVSFIYTLNYKGGEVDFIAKMENVFNTKYRDYMNRYRYFANDLGRNIAFKIQISF
ncbi:MAG TPA: TonB-dependent receptor, partial [Taishania sp.]|nr:TonB-dependent receptor [Taishania sp.]